MSKIVTLGEILVEFLAEQKNQSFAKAGKILGPYPSGAPAIFIDQVGKLGTDCAIIGTVGNDDFGRLNIERLKEDGVNTNHIKIHKTNTTGSAFVTYKDNGSRDFIYYITNAACSDITEDMVTEQNLSVCSVFHLMGSSLSSQNVIKAVRKAIKIVKNQGGVLSFDPNIRKEMLAIEGMKEALQDFIQQADLILPSEGELALLFQTSQEQPLIEKLLSGNTKEIVIKLGSKGCHYYHRNGTQLTVPGFQVDEIDPTGAGDCFGGTFVALRHQNYEAEKALLFANAAGALAVTQSGPMEGNSDKLTLEKFLASQTP